MQDLQATIQQILDYIKGIWIKKRFIIISTWLICPLGLFLVAKMPDVYESKAKIYADTRSMLKPLLRGLAIQTDSKEEINAIARTLKSTPNLEDIARKADLDISAKTPQEFQGIVENLRNKIIFNSSGRTSIYSISFEHPDPQIAKRVVSLTLDKFVESALGQNRQDSTTASNFLDEQLQEYATRLASSEQRLADFKKQYGDLLPESGGSGYYQQRGQLKTQIESINLELSEKQTQLQSLKSKFATSTTNEGNPDNVNIATQYDQRIAQMQANLDDLQIRFTDKHPDVLQTRERLESLQQQRKSEIDQLMKGLSNGELAAGSLSENAIVQQLTIVINNLESNIASLNVRKQSYVEKLDVLEQKLELIPDIEAKRTALNRDYGITKRKYEELLSRKESADLSRKADLSAEDVQFRIIDPPVVPLAASGPKRALLYTGVLIVSFGAGVALAFLFSQLNPVIINANHLTKITGRPVLGAVTDINLAEINKRDRRRMWVFAASSSVILGLYLVFMFSEIVMKKTPLQLMERFI
ncbi:XrtA system polysaccharide chain length determinant [Psychrosphaera aestuarii]|uniref:XrtA system polysaccharide chain length determinant n=1 Tax=Psychrosphaera aestuarii TaxID=1266052 RepID=UPI001B31DE9A|nr:XrtA system polysaccharide chain length determinant [Psychrosphaera aestuarii]